MSFSTAAARAPVKNMAALVNKRCVEAAGPCVVAGVFCRNWGAVAQTPSARKNTYPSDLWAGWSADDPPSIHTYTHKHTHNSGLASARKFFVGGNWKCNGSVSQVDVSSKQAHAPVFRLLRGVVGIPAGLESDGL